MPTIMICGCGGSGKSELASQLGQRLNLEYYDEHWNPLDPELFAQSQRERVAAPPTCGSSCQDSGASQ